MFNIGWNGKWIPSNHTHTHSCMQTDKSMHSHKTYIYTCIHTNSTYVNACTAGQLNLWDRFELFLFETTYRKVMLFYDDGRYFFLTKTKYIYKQRNTHIHTNKEKPENSFLKPFCWNYLSLHLLHQNVIKGQSSVDSIRP